MKVRLCLLFFVFYITNIYSQTGQWEKEGNHFIHSNIFNSLDFLKFKNSGEYFYIHLSSGSLYKIDFTSGKIIFVWEKLKGFSDLDQETERIIYAVGLPDTTYIIDLNTDSAIKNNYKFTISPRYNPGTMSFYNYSKTPFFRFSNKPNTVIGFADFTYQSGGSIWDGAGGILDYFSEDSCKVISNLINSSYTTAFAESDDGRTAAFSFEYHHVDKLNGYVSYSSSLLCDTKTVKYTNFSGVQSGITNFSFSRDKSMILGLSSNKMYVWNTSDGSIVSITNFSQNENNPTNIFDAKFSNNGKYIITSVNINPDSSHDASSIIQIRNLKGEVLADSIFYSESCINNRIYVSRDSNSFITSGNDNYIRLFKNDLLTDIENEFEIKSEFMISPNPATDFIEISVGVRHAEPLQSDVKIYNVFGQSINLTPTLSPSGEGVRIDVSGLAPGMYFVRIGDRVGKFVKVK